MQTAAEITAEARTWVESRALAAGFDSCGIAAVPRESPLDSARYAAWVAAGRAGEMEYMKRVDEAGELLRGDLLRAMPWARSVIVCAVNYNAAAPKSTDPASDDAGWIARYAWSAGPSGGAADYHDTMLPKLKILETELRERFGEMESRCYVDTGPIVERVYAQRAGVGWIGKNTCVLSQDLGSWLLLGVIVTSLELAEEAWSIPAADRCGSCTRCIDACPTDALLPGRQMDASLCIAYLTIEKKGSIDVELRDKMGRQVFGCDICQDVCPWNRRAPIGNVPTRVEMVNPALEWLAEMDNAAFKRWFAGSPLERTRRKRVQRNVAIAMGNSGQQKFLPRLQQWAAGHDTMLAEAAKWAIEKLSKSAEPQVSESTGVALDSNANERGKKH